MTATLTGVKIASLLCSLTFGGCSINHQEIDLKEDKKNVENAAAHHKNSDVRKTHRIRSQHP